ncbi:MAG: nicotinate-nucleotide adenylyltransferase, partial [Chloroflexi bacterium]|nr:nicotinate-nucleotide adenylyltransferase [Chloroflexota bacterium]
FDPIHYGHLTIANEVRHLLDLDRMLIVPAGRPPHKHRTDITPAEQRAEMVALGIASNPHFELSRVDVDRAGYSYTVDTLRVLREQLGADDVLYFVVGSDSLKDLPEWHRPLDILRLALLVSVSRPGEPSDHAALERDLPGALQRVVQVSVPQLQISSSDLRRRVAEGRPIKYQLPEPVESYVYRQGLYRRP